MENVLMCKAEKEHIYACAEIISKEHAWQVYGFDFEKSVRVLETMEDVIYIAKLNGEVAGFITLRINGVGNIGAYVRMIAVNSEYRNKGVRKAMVDYIQPIAHDNGMDNIFLICSTDNPKGERFYLHRGFMKVGILQSLVVEGHDEILFRRKYNQWQIQDLEKC